MAGIGGRVLGIYEWIKLQQQTGGSTSGAFITCATTAVVVVAGDVMFL